MKTKKKRIVGYCRGLRSWTNILWDDRYFFRMIFCLNISQWRVYPIKETIGSLVAFEGVEKRADQLIWKMTEQTSNRSTKCVIREREEWQVNHPGQRMFINHFTAIPVVISRQSIVVCSIVSNRQQWSSCTYVHRVHRDVEREVWTLHQLSFRLVCCHGVNVFPRRRFFTLTRSTKRG